MESYEDFHSITCTVFISATLSGQITSPVIKTHLCRTWSAQSSTVVWRQWSMVSVPWLLVRSRLSWCWHLMDLRINMDIHKCTNTSRYMIHVSMHAPMYIQSSDSIGEHLNYKRCLPIVQPPFLPCIRISWSSIVPCQQGWA